MRDDYLLVGEHTGDIAASEGWAAKVSPTGNALWQLRYHTDTVFSQFLLDAIELPNGNILLCGGAVDHTAPQWHGYDVWILGIDRNGCEVPNCNGNTGIAKVPQLNAQVYPNPTTGNLTVQMPEAGMLYLSDVQGKQLATYPIKQGKTMLQLGPWPAGIYTGKLVGKETGKTTVVRIVYQP